MCAPGTREHVVLTPMGAVFQVLFDPMGQVFQVPVIVPGTWELYPFWPLFTHWVSPETRHPMGL